jgi:membrane protease YdiL (CAAX protease family)
MFDTQKSLPLYQYIIGAIVIVAAVATPYFVPIGGILGYLVVYGIPIVVVSLFFGRQLLSRAAKNNKDAFRYGLGFFSSFYLIGVIASAFALMIILQFAPSATSLLEKTNPALDVSPNVAWIMMAVSMLVIGPAEEYLFRGFLFGGLLSVSKGKHWLLMAIISSLIFTSAHGYYALTYTVASPVFFIQLFTFSLAMCLTYYYSGGNLVAMAVVHGLNDAIGFLGVATTSEVARIAQIIFLTIGFAFAIWLLLKKVALKPYPEQEPASATSSVPV